jgi:opacity protein-like surface antigen
MEVGYADLGEAKFSDDTSSATAEVNGMTIQVVGTYAFNPSFSLIGRGSMNILELEVNGTVDGNVGDDVAWSLGLGAQYNLSKSVGLRAEWERTSKSAPPMGQAKWTST